MDIRKIESICAVDEHRSYSEAAYHIHSTQAVVSKHVAAVEQELGVRLFERATKSHGVLLTPEGEKAMPYFHEILCQYRLLCKEFDPEKNSGAGALTVGYVPRIGSFRENSILAGFQLEQPNTVVRRKTASSKDMVDILLDGTVDAVFIPLLEGTDTLNSNFVRLNDPNIEILEIMYMSRLSLGLPVTHRLAGLDEIPEREFASLQNEVFIFSSSDHGHREQQSILSTKLGIPGELKAIYTDFSDQRMALELVEAGAGILPQMCLVPPQLGNVRFVPLEGDSGTCITLYLVCRKNNPNRTLRQFIRFVRSNSATYYQQFPYVVTPAKELK